MWGWRHPWPCRISCRRGCPWGAMDLAHSCGLARETKRTRGHFEIAQLCRRIFPGFVIALGIPHLD